MQSLSNSHLRYLCGSGLLLGERSKSQIGLDNPEVREESLGLLVLNTGVDNDIIARYPVDRGCDAAASRLARSS